MLASAEYLEKGAARIRRLVLECPPTGERERSAVMSKIIRRGCSPSNSEAIKVLLKP